MESTDVLHPGDTLLTLDNQKKHKYFVLTLDSLLCFLKLEHLNVSVQNV